MTLWLLAALLIVAFSVWGWRHTDSAGAFFAASRSVGPLLAGIGGTAAGLSVFVFVGGPGYFAAVGAASLWIILSAPITGALQCWIVGEPVVSMVRRHGCLTVPDLVATRFGEGWPRGLTALAVAAGAIATLAVQIKGSAIIGEVLLGVPGWLVAMCTIVATIAYTASGGMRTGILAEAFQGLVMATCAVALAVSVLDRAGGPRHAMATIAKLRPDLLDPWGPDGATAAVSLFFLFALGTCAQPHYIQKFLLLRDASSLRWLPAVMTGALLAVLTVWIGVGLGGTALWLQGDLYISSPDQLTPAVLLASGSRSLIVLAAVAVVAAVMSTAASLLNLAAAAITRDLPRTFGRTPAQGLGAARVATVAVGISAAGVALLSGRPVALLGVLGWGMFTAALLPVIAIGLVWSRASRRGAIAALGTGPAVQLIAEWARTTGLIGPRWEPGLLGAAVGALTLVALAGKTSEDGR